MRRARIKAVAMLPARRKATRDVAEESTESVNPVSNGNAENISVIEAEPSTANIREIKIEASTIPIVKEEVCARSQESLAIQEAVQQAAPQIPEPSRNESAEKIFETKGSPIKENHNRQKRISESENCPSVALGEAKVSSHNETSLTKVSQTRTSFMRPIPRLDGGGRMRRNSVQGSGASASESEDDCRRTSIAHSSRVRNDSVSSVHSAKGHSQSGSNAGSSNAADANVVGNTGTCTPSAKTSSTLSCRQKRKMVVSESARKLAESRREFLLKHEHKQPDRTKLIMYDLIYYNPVSNPMKKSDGSRAAAQKTPSTVSPETEDEDEDDGEAEGEAMPVPQVKVGPDGSLMIDEQSLVIEHTGAKKGRQTLARTEALVDDDNNGSGFYKKRQKSKDWPKWETLKFYKALTSIGTDFLLMQNLFPNRTRQEIKMKYKKEEKLNPRLVEKALTYHQEFDIDSLKVDLATFEETEKRRSEIAKPEKRPASRQGGRVKRKKNKSRRMAAASIGEQNDPTDDPDDPLETASCVSAAPSEEVLRAEKKKATQRRGAASSEARTRTTELMTSSEDSASDTEIYQVKPTRSGRKPKVRKLQAPTINTLDNLFSDPEQEIEEPISPSVPSSSVNDPEPEREISDAASENCDIADDEAPSSDNAVVAERLQSVNDSLAGISQVEPGSLVIVSRESAEDPGETVLQVYMVSSDIDDGTGNGSKRNMTPVVLTPELLNTVTAGITKVAPIDMKTE